MRQRVLSWPSPCLGSGLVLIAACGARTGLDDGAFDASPRDAGADAGWDAGTDSEWDAGRGAWIDAEMAIVSDSSWRASTEGPPGWEEVEFDESAWPSAVSPAPVNCGWSFTPGSVGRPYREWEHSGTLTMWSLEQERLVHLRKSFSLPASANVTSAMVTTLADDDHVLSVNGTQVFDEHNNWAGPVIETDIAPYLVPGANVIAILGDDSFGGCRHVTVMGTIVWREPED